MKVVTGFRAYEVVEAVKPLGVTVICNPDFDKGMYSYVQAGLRTLEPCIQAFFILPVDHLLIAPAAIKKMLDGCRLNSHSIIYPVFNDEIEILVRKIVDIAYKIPN